jgi:hypothetical protein
MNKSGGNEAHITANLLDATEVRKVGDEIGWVFSQISGCPLLGQGTYCYLTSYDRDAARLRRELEQACQLLKKRGIDVLRSKIEHIVFDSKTGVDEMNA